MRLLIVAILLNGLSAAGQSLPDSIVLVKKTYVNNFTNNDKLYQTNRSSVVKRGESYLLNRHTLARSTILELLAAISEPDTDHSLAQYGLDTNWIKDNGRKLLAYYDHPERFAWNENQREFIYTKLTDLNNYRKGLDTYLSTGRGYTMHHSYREQYIVQLFINGVRTEQITSRKYVWGYKLPWTNQRGDTLYDYGIERALDKILPTKQKTQAPLQGENLTRYLVNRIVDNNEKNLFQLSAYSYLKEIEELKSDFDILSFSEVEARGRYIWDEPATMRIVLKNKQMMDNVNIVFLASRTGETIYSRDSLKADYKSFIQRIQSINFVTRYLQSHPDVQLDIYYFNNTGINEYNIKGVNTNADEWKEHDDYLGSLENARRSGVKSSFDTREAIKTSQQLYCGCNYRFDRSYIEQAIFFETKDKEGNSSIWFLLPDDKVLLYIMDGETALNYKRSQFQDARESGLIYPCALFDTNGNKVPK